MKEPTTSTSSRLSEEWLNPVTLTILCLAFLLLVSVSVNVYRQYLAAHREGVPPLANGRTIQIAVESFQIKAGRYPATLKEIEPFLPYGSSMVGGSPGKWPENDYSSNPFEPTVVEDNELRTTADLKESRHNPAKLKKRKPGLIVYCQLDNGQSYAIYTMDRDGIPVPKFFTTDMSDFAIAGEK